MAKPASAPLKNGEKLSRIRQRQKLIDACISALYLHGPSRTTIDKVVAIADMSPGIVNFYFETKAALLVAALEHLAVEFEERVQVPLEALRTDPVRALPRLIELYLDPEIASPRKVSVWYAFWGEASSRHEYQEICGKRDQAFADLVRDLMARLIRQCGAAHLNADSVALGLIGALEMTWQDIAFREEADIDRAAARRRCVAYLESVFPDCFGAAEARPAADISPAAYASGDVYADLVAAELTLAGVPAFALARDWLGFQVAARPAGGSVARIAVRAAERDGWVTYADGEVFDWLAIILMPVNDRAVRRVFVVPRRVVDAVASREGTRVVLNADSPKIAGYEGNFQLK